MDEQVFRFVQSVVGYSTGMLIGFLIVYTFSLNTLPDRIMLAWWRLFPPKQEITNAFYITDNTRFLDINGDGLPDFDGTVARTSP